ncbi:translation initiation factor IF-1 [bacterium]|nr:translation initiation factor IF-1 [bacterium]MCI0679972.1 translation initiation factor IF-1 [bacterium]
MINGQKGHSETITGTVVEALPNALFRIEYDGPGTDTIKEDKGGKDADGTDNGRPRTFIAYLSGKMKVNRIRILVGDKVLVEPDEYGGKGRITRRI